MRSFIKHINETRKTTIILTTHDLGDIQELCKRIIIINKGVVIEDGSLEELVDRIAPFRQLVIDFYTPQSIEHPQAEIVSKEGARTVYRFMKNEISAAKLIEDIGSKAKIKDFRLEEASIEDIIRVAYAGSGAPTGSSAV